jgi:Sec1 family
LGCLEYSQHQAHFLATFGDLGTSLKNYVQSYQSRSLAQSPSTINSISDMKRLVEEYPEFRKLGGNVNKHVALVGELSRLLGRDKLLDVGEVEQGLATNSGADFKVFGIFTFPVAQYHCFLPSCRAFRQSSLTLRCHLGINFVLSFYMLYGTRKQMLPISHCSSI